VSLVGDGRALDLRVKKLMSLHTVGSLPLKGGNDLFSVNHDFEAARAPMPNGTNISRCIALS
jgi:hypothetical protein